MSDQITPIIMHANKRDTISKTKIPTYSYRHVYKPRQIIIHIDHILCSSRSLKLIHIGLIKSGWFNYQTSSDNIIPRQVLPIYI